MWKKSSLLLLVCCQAFAGALQRFEAVEPHMGTLFGITVYAPDAASANAAVRAAFDRVKDLDDALSDYKPDSELNRVCRSAYEQPVKVSADLFTVLEAAQQLAQESDGAFDVTVGPVIRLWRQGRIPSANELRDALEKSGFRKLILDRAKRTVSLASPAMQLDLGGIAKGYAADQALVTLREHGIPIALVAASGDIAVGDPPPGQAGWRVRVDCPDAAQDVLTLQHAAVSTSGDREQFVEGDGVRYSHIIDPKTGLGLTNSSCVTVAADSGLHADSMATALSVLTAQHGRDYAIAFARRHPHVRLP